MKFLIVDDSATMRRILMNTLKKIGHDQFVEAENGEQALQKFKEGGVDVIITDWNMPVMNGLDLILAVRKYNPNVPILMVTTNAAKSDIIEAIKAGANNYIVKPFTPDTLEGKLSSIIQDN
jgi:two-component system, chemotaxis family, chemotaxis protein CheY